NMPQGICTDFAAFSIRAVTIPLYATSSEEQVKYIVNDAQVRIMFVGEQQQYNVAYAVMKQCTTLQLLVIYDNKVKKNPADNTSIYFDDFIKDKVTTERKNQLEALRKQLSFDDIANILYTSGTTGEPKGVMLHHSCYDAQWGEHLSVLPQLSLPNQVSMNFLPLTHVFERAWTFLCMEAGIVVCVSTNPHIITQSLLEVRPTMMCSVPRFWEKVYDGVQAKIAAMPKILKMMVRAALKVGHTYNIQYEMKGIKAPWWLEFRYNIVNKTIFNMLKKAVGIENGVLFPTAGAAIPPTVEEFIHSCGIPMVAGYGLTESTATVSCDRRPASIGSIGRPLPGVQVKIGEENEILIKGASVTRGYYKKEQANQEAFDADGFFHTGDAGYLKDGELYITDRTKDLFKTSNGKYVAPQVLESKLCVDKYIDQLAIIADKRKFVSALIIPAYGEIKKYAETHHIAFASMQELCDNPEINQMILERINQLQSHLAAYEQVKRITLLPEPFSMEKGELTNTLKIKRPVLSRNYAVQIAKMYEE
ncbi:MAG: long-chain fatty acid--CoA ligase, partial [Bacteroidales bacterium]|nr:long-chain fatty acid--CoA ligase [Candidatus Minthousia equi]